jgi:hypothetical protein
MGMMVLQLAASVLVLAFYKCENRDKAPEKKGTLAAAAILNFGLTEAKFFERKA